MLFGESGACKTLFLIKLIIELYNDKKFDQHLISYRKLRDLAGQGKDSKKLIQNLLSGIYKDINEGNDDGVKPILILLDGFDELNNKYISVYRAL